MYVHHGAGLIYLANPRTASRSTAKALMGIGFKMVGSHHSYEVGTLRPASDFRWVVFTTVRDIATLLPSWARHDGGKTVQEFVTTSLPGIRPIIADWEPWELLPHVKHADRILHFENIEEELNELLADFGLGPVALERIGFP